MSKANILKQEKLRNGRVRLTFDTHDGRAIYEYKGSSVAALKRGKDPARLAGKLVSLNEH